MQNPYSPYDVAALNKPYGDKYRDMSLTPAQQSSLSNALQQLQSLAEELQGNPEALLQHLRQLEALHRTIQDGPFRNSLPADRNRLFELLQNMESSGGWPYIPRLQLRTFMDLMQNDVEPGEEPLAA